jgi:hypothetical protein
MHILGSVFVTSFLSLAAAQVPGTRLADGTVIPDMTGVWERAEGIRFDPSGKPPPLSPAFAERFRLDSEARARGEVIADPTSRCLPQGMPRFMVASYPLEILQTGKQVTIIAEWSSQVRRIFTDGRKHPPADEVEITFNGHSIGHWEGQTLVVDTTGIRGDTSFDATPLRHSDKIHVSERLRLTDANTLQAVITVTDSGALTRPWVVTRHYKRGGPELQIMEYVCEENNREIILPGQRSGNP